MSKSPPPLEFRKPEETVGTNIYEMATAFKLTGDEKLTLKKARVVMNKVLAMKGSNVAGCIKIQNKACHLKEFINEMLEQDDHLTILVKQEELLVALQDLRDDLKNTLKK